MMLDSLRPIDANLKRILSAFGRSTTKLNPEAFKFPKIERISDRFQELHYTLLGAMVAAQTTTLGNEKELLQELRKQILVMRKFKTSLEEMEFLGSNNLQTQVKLTLVAFYDFEGILRKRSGGKVKKTARLSDLVNAIAEKSKTAMAIAIQRNK